MQLTWIGEFEGYLSSHHVNKMWKGNPKREGAELISGCGAAPPLSEIWLFRAQVMEAYTVRDGMHADGSWSRSSWCRGQDRCSPSGEPNVLKWLWCCSKYVSWPGIWTPFVWILYLGRLMSWLIRAKQCSSDRKRYLWINYIPTFLDACIRKECDPGWF